MHFYRQSIILFGIILPTVLAVAIFSVCMVAQKRIAGTFLEKAEEFKSYEQNRKGALVIEAEVNRERPHLERWKTQLSEETASAVTTNLRTISELLPGREFQQTAFERPSGSGGFGAASAQKSSQIRIAFRGTYRSAQRAFLELETRMPQLQLQELRIDPNSTQPSMINFQVNYTAWEH
jgi:hypothetical protein